MIGIVGQSLENLWQQRLAADAGRALLANNRFALILDAAGDPVRQRALAAQLRDQQVDGLIVSPIDASDPFWAQLAGTLAVVSIGERVAGAAGEVMFDNDRAIAAALQQLRALGHRRIAYLCPAGGPADEHASVPIVGRLAAGLGLEVSVTVTPYELAAATRTAHHILGDLRGVTAIFCFSDSFAHGVYAAARELGLAIPDDISVIGYDDQVISALLTPPLTSVDWSSTQLMEIAVEMVLGAIDGERPSNPVVIEGTLRQRASTGPPPVARTRTRQGLPRAPDQLPSAP
jgi:LacI family transcriptional regulator